MNAIATKLIISLWRDDCPESPNEYDGWKAYSFSDRHSNYKSPEEIGFDDDDNVDWPNKDLKAKLDTGLAFILDYYEHGQCAWSLAGEGHQCRWDTTRMAGILVWELAEDEIGGKTVEDRRKDAKAFIDRFTLWCNGEVYGYTMEAYRVCITCAQDEELTEEETGLYLPSCGGYYSDDFNYMVETIKEHIGDDWADYKVEFKDNIGGSLADECRDLWEGK